MQLFLFTLDKVIWNGKLGGGVNTCVKKFKNKEKYRMEYKDNDMLHQGDISMCRTWPMRPPFQ